MMIDIFHAIDDTSSEYSMDGNYVAGVNIVGFKKVALSMFDQAVV
jgi:glutamate dehydrogenase (NADP+)